MRRQGAALLALVHMGCFTVAERPASTETIERTPQRIARGQYLAENLAGCIHCHSDHDAASFGWPTRPGTEGQGGFAFTKELGGVPGVVTAQNITPDVETGKGGWTDGELMRAIREGVDKDGRAVFPMMPYTAYRFMSDEDLRSVVAYVRTLKPLSHATPPVQIDFPVSLFIRKVPQPVTEVVPNPDPSNAAEYGRYVANLAGCIECHTHHNGRGQKDGPPGGGGWEFVGPWGTAVSGNITPSATAGIGRWSRLQFIGRFKSFEELRSDPPRLPAGTPNTPMSWVDYAGLTEVDLGALYDYLSTLEPVDAAVETFPEPLGTSSR